MNLDENEKYLLKYLSNYNLTNNPNNDLYNILDKFGIKLRFIDSNPVYQIIDEMDFFGMSNSFV